MKQVTVAGSPNFIEGQTYTFGAAPPRWRWRGWAVWLDRVWVPPPRWIGWRRWLWLRIKTRPFHFRIGRVPAEAGGVFRVVSVTADTTIEIEEGGE